MHCPGNNKAQDSEGLEDPEGPEGLRDLRDPEGSECLKGSMEGPESLKCLEHRECLGSS